MMRELIRGGSRKQYSARMGDGIFEAPILLRSNHPSAIDDGRSFWNSAQLPASPENTVANERHAESVSLKQFRLAAKQWLD